MERHCRFAVSTLAILQMAVSPREIGMSMTRSTTGLVPVIGDVGVSVEETGLSPGL